MQSGIQTHVKKGKHTGRHAAHPSQTSQTYRTTYIQVSRPISAASPHHVMPVYLFVSPDHTGIIHKQGDKHTQTYINKNKHANNATNIQSDIQPDKHADRPTNKQADTPTSAASLTTAKSVYRSLPAPRSYGHHGST